MRRVFNERLRCSTTVSALALALTSISIVEVAAQPATGTPPINGVGIVHADAPRAFAIAAQALGSALRQFLEQSGVQVTYKTEELSGLQTRGVAGNYSPEEALRQLLADTGVTWQRTGTNTIVLTKPSQTGEVSDIQLGPVRVEGGGLPTTSMIGNVPPPYAGGQVGRGGQLGLLGNKDMMDTPFNQTSYTAAKAQEQQAHTIREVLIDDPSVQFDAAANSADGDNLRIRGFRLFSPSYGGLYGILPSWSVAVELAERIEVLKGPSAMLNGISPDGVVGGSVNIVAKRAPDKPLLQVTPSYSSSAQVGGHLDTGYRFGQEKQFGVRFNAVYRDGETAVEDNSEQRVLAALGLDYRGDRIRLSTDIGYQKQDIEGVVIAAPLANGVPLPPPPDASTNFGQPWSTRNHEDLFGVIRGEVDFNDSMTAYLTFGINDFRRKTLVPAILGITNIVGDMLQIPVATNEYSVTKTGEAGLRGEFSTGQIAHEVAFNLSALTMETGATFGLGSISASNIYNPILAPKPNISLLKPSKSSSKDQSSIAVADTLSAFEKRVQLTLGGRIQKVQSGNFDAGTGAKTVSYNKNAFSPSVALVVKPVEKVSIYGNYIQGLQQGTTVGATFANVGEVFPPFKSEQYEAGIKVDWGKFATTASIFQITQPSIITDVPSNTLRLAGEQRNRGLELNFFGMPAEDVRVLGGMMFLDAKLTKTQGGLTDGLRAPSSPTVQIRFGAEWDTPFARGLTLHGRVVHTGSQYIDTLSPRRSLPKSTRFDAGARYVLGNLRGLMGQKITIRLNVENMFDKNYWTPTYWLGTPRTFKLSSTVTF